MELIYLSDQSFSKYRHFENRSSRRQLNLCVMSNDFVTTQDPRSPPNSRSGVGFTLTRFVGLSQCVGLSMSWKLPETESNGFSYFFKAGFNSPWRSQYLQCSRFKVCHCVSAPATVSQSILVSPSSSRLADAHKIIQIEPDYRNFFRLKS